MAGAAVPPSAGRPTGRSPLRPRAPRVATPTATAPRGGGQHSQPHRHRTDRERGAPRTDTPAAETVGNVRAPASRGQRDAGAIGPDPPGRGRPDRGLRAGEDCQGADNARPRRGGGSVRRGGRPLTGAAGQSTGVGPQPALHQSGLGHRGASAEHGGVRHMSGGVRARRAGWTGRVGGSERIRRNRRCGLFPGRGPGNPLRGEIRGAVRWGGPRQVRRVHLSRR